ncbi:acyl carrier protein [Streptomyces sp. NPDC004270]
MSTHPENTSPAPSPQHMSVAAVQDMVCAILRSVFGRHEINLDVHFLDLGGSSIEALRVVDLIERQIGAVVPIALVFEAPTIRLLCASLTEIVAA